MGISFNFLFFLDKGKSLQLSQDEGGGTKNSGSNRDDFLITFSSRKKVMRKKELITI